MGDSKLKYTTEYLKQLCNEKDLILVGIDNKELNGKNRRCACILCNKHKDKGVQWLRGEANATRKNFRYH